MSVGRNFVIEDHLDIDELNHIVKDAKLSNKISIRAIFIRMLKQGSTIKDASKAVGVARQTGSRWLERYNEEGYDGLVPKFDGGRPGQLTEEEKIELKGILSDEKSNYTISESRKLIKELYNIDFSYNRTWTLVRKEFGLNYSKPLSIAHKRPQYREKVLKKN
jgi:putative transposase